MAITTARQLDSSTAVSDHRAYCLLPSSRRARVVSRGQSAIEYTVLIAVAVAALLSLSIYTKRSLMGRWRSIGDTFGYGRQFEPGVTSVSK